MKPLSRVGRLTRTVAPLLVLVTGATTATTSTAAQGPTFRVGVTHTQYTADEWKDPTAVARAKTVLRSSVRLQAQALMGWGTMNPEPSPGVYDWASLDERLRLIASTGGTPIVTLCCSPDWMKGGAEGTTDWSHIEWAPDAAHYADFAALAATFARRHPEVRNYIVWNELKGFYNPATNSWDAAAYTRLYNAVYDALKAVDRTLVVGGPYVPMDIWSTTSVMSHPSTLTGAFGVVDRRALDAVEYWLANAHGADMVVVDGGTWTKDRGVIGNDTTATTYFSVVTKWLRARTTKPIWWSEFTAARTPGTSVSHGVNVLSSALSQMKSAGVSVAMQWQPEGPDLNCVSCLWTDTAVPTGGVKAPFADVVRNSNGL